jgi:hypothetical protein
MEAEPPAPERNGGCFSTRAAGPGARDAWVDTRGRPLINATRQEEGKPLSVQSPGKLRETRRSRARYFGGGGFCRDQGARRGRAGLGFVLEVGRIGILPDARSAASRAACWAMILARFSSACPMDVAFGGNHVAPPVLVVSRARTIHAIDQKCDARAGAETDS